MKLWVYMIGTPHGGSSALEIANIEINKCLWYLDLDLGMIHINECLWDLNIKIGELEDISPNDIIACEAGDPVWDSLSDTGMEQFNGDYPYSEFKVDGKQMPFLAFHFQEPLCGGASDCVVGTASQTWDGAPKYPDGSSLQGVHSPDLYDNVCGYWNGIVNAASCDDLCSPICTLCVCGWYCCVSGVCGPTTEGCPLCPGSCEYKCLGPCDKCNDCKSTWCPDAKNAASCKLNPPLDRITPPIQFR